MFEFLKKKKKENNQEPVNNPPSEGWVCGTPAAMQQAYMEEANKRIPAEVMQEVEAEVDEKFKDNPKVRKYKYWEEKKWLLHNRGYEWFSPADFNPRTYYD